jgi:hypothetical protein
VNLKEINQLKEIMNREKYWIPSKVEVELSFYRHLKAAALLAEESSVKPRIW